MANDIRVDVRGDMKRAMLDISALHETVVTKATYRALNRALDRTATETSREIRKEYNVRHRAVMSALKKRRATSKSLFAQLRIEGVRIPMIEFGARWTPRMSGVSVQVKVKGARKIIPGTFIAASTANNYRGGGSMGMKHVYRRVGRRRLPLMALRSISIPQAISNKAVLAALEKITRDEFSKEYERQLRLHVSRW